MLLTVARGATALPTIRSSSRIRDCGEEAAGTRGGAWWGKWVSQATADTRKSCPLRPVALFSRRKSRQAAAALQVERRGRASQ